MSIKINISSSNLHDIDIKYPLDNNNNNKIISLLIIAIKCIIIIILCLFIIFTLFIFNYLNKIYKL